MAVAVAVVVAVPVAAVLLESVFGLILPVLVLAIALPSSLKMYVSVFGPSYILTIFRPRQVGCKYDTMACTSKPSNRTLLLLLLLLLLLWFVTVGVGVIVVLNICWIECTRVGNAIDVGHCCVIPSDEGRMEEVVL